MKIREITFWGFQIYRNQARKTMVFDLNANRPKRKLDN